MSNPIGSTAIYGQEPAGDNGAVGVTAPTAATGTLTLSGNAVAGETVTVGTRVYTWAAVINSTNNQTPNLVLVRSNASDSIYALIDTIIGTAATQGIYYSFNTVPNAQASAAAGAGDTMTTTARQPGSLGNTVITTETMSAGSWGAAALTGGIAGALLTSTTITPSGTQNVNLTQVGGASIALGPAAAAASLPVTETGAANGPVSRVTSTGVAQTLFIARPTRVGVLVRNTDTANSVWIGPATVTSSNGFLLKAGESLPIPFTGLYQIIDDGSNHAVIHVMDNYN